MGNICHSTATAISPRDTMATFDKNGKENGKTAYMSFESRSITSALQDRRDQVSSVGANGTEEQTRYQTVHARFFSFQGSWLGNVVGTTKLKKYAFTRNTQLFLKIEKKTKTTFLVHQESFGRNKQAACLYIFKCRNNGRRVRTFRESDIFYKSKVSMRPIKVDLELEPIDHSYVIVVSHTTTREGGYTLAIEGDQEMTLNVPKQYTTWFDKPNRHKILISGEWKGESASGSPETNPSEWLKHSNQIPLLVKKPTRCLIRLIRTTPFSLSMGVFAVKSNGQASSEQYYAHQTLLDEDVVGQSGYTNLDTIEFRSFLQPKIHPYIFIPVVETKGVEGTFDLEIYSDEEIQEVKQNRIKKSSEEQGIWFERSCGGRPGTDRFFRCPQFFVTIKTHDEQTRTVPVTITVEQHVEMNQYIPAGFYVLKAGYRVSKKNFQENMIIARKPSGFMKKITTEVLLNNGQSYTVIPCPRSYNFSRDIPFTITLSTFLPSDTSITFDPCPENSDEFDNMEEFKCTRIEGTWTKLTSGGDPLSGKGFFNNPQYSLNTDVRTRLEISVTRITQKWIPMAFFIVRTSEANKLLSQLDDLHKDSNGLFGHVEESSAGDRIIGQVRFTSGVEEEVSGNFTLASGTYTIIVASQISGKVGDFVLQIKSDQDVEVFGLPQIECFSTNYVGSFLGGLSALYPQMRDFRNNPKYTCTCPVDQLVFLSLSQPPAQLLNLCLYVKCNDELVSSSQIFSWKEVTIQMTMLKDTTYDIYVATNAGKEGEYILSAYSDVAPVDLIPSSNVIEKRLSRFTLTDCGSKVRGEWFGLCDSTENNAFNPKYKLIVDFETEEILIEFTIQSNVNSLGLRITRDSTLVYDSGIIENTSNNLFVRRVLLSTSLEYDFEVYPGQVSSRKAFTISLRSTSPIFVAEIPTKTQYTTTLESAWNIGRTPGSNYRHPNFVHNPQWIIRVDKHTRYVFEIEWEHEQKDTIRMETPKYTTTNLFDESEDYITLSKTEECSAALFLIRSNSASSSQLDTVSQEDIVCWSGWRSVSDATLEAVLESSDKPYFIVVSGLGFPRTAGQNAFHLNVYSDQETISSQILPVVGKIFNAFEPDATFIRNSIQVKWNLHAIGHPNELHHQQEWIKNNKIKAFIPTDAKCKFSVIHPLNQAIGMVILKSHPSNSGEIVPNLYENIVFADSIYDPEDEIDSSIYVYLPASDEPYYVIPFCYTFQRESKYELVMESDTSDSRLELDYDIHAITDPITFQSGWRFGIAGGEPFENPTSFSRNPRYYLEISDTAKDDILLSLESKSKNKIKLFIFKRTIDEDSDTASIQEELVQCSKWSLSGGTSCELACVPGSYVIIPSIYPAYQGDSFVLKVQKGEGINAVADEVNLVYPTEEGTSYPSKKLSFSQLIVSSIESVIENFSELNTVSFEIKDDYSNMRVQVSHESVYSTIGFLVFKGIITASSVPPSIASIAVKSNFISFAPIASVYFALEKGEYTLVPVVLSHNVKQSLPSKEKIFVEIESNSDSVSLKELPNTITEIDVIPSIPHFQPAEIIENPDAAVLLDGISQIALRDDENGRFASPLTIFGPTIFPLLTGTSTSLFMYESHNKSRRRILERLDKLAISNRTLVDLYLPYAGAGTFGKGRVIAIGDPFVFSRHQLTTCDNFAFLMNCIAWLLPDSNNSMQVDMIVASPRGGGQMYRGSAAPGSSPRRLSVGPSSAPILLSSSSPGEIVGAAKNAASRNKISKPTIVCFSRLKDLLPVESLSYDYVVKTVNSLEKVIEIKCDIILLIIDPLDVAEEELLTNITEEVRLSGTGLLVLSSCHVDDDIRKSSTHIANQLLGKVGMVFGDSDIIENGSHNHDHLWWMSQEEKKSYAKPQRFELQTPSLLVSQSVHRMAHVGQCLRLLQNMQESEDKTQSQEYQQLCHILYQACYNIPSNDTFILPKLLELFGNPTLKVSAQEPILKPNMHERFAMALNTNLWLNMYYRDMPSLRDREFTLDAETQEVTLSKDFQGDFSTGIYARSGEEITVTVPNSLVGVGCYVQIGHRTQNLIWLRDSDLYRYSLQWIREPISNNKTTIANPFGGQVYITIPSTVYRSIKKQPIRLHITGGCVSPHFKWQQTTTQQWQQMVSDTSIPYSEWICDRVILTIPTKDAKLVSDPSLTLKFWRDAVYYMEKIAHSRFPHTQRIILDSQIVAGYSLSGYPCIVHENLLWKGIIALKEDQLFDHCNLIREIAHNMHQKHSYVWNQRSFPIANVYKAYALHKIVGINANETEFYSKNIGLVRDFLHQGDDLSRAKRLQMYQNNTSLSTMFEFILIEEFGWEPYEKLFKFFHSEFDVKNRRILTNQEKVDRWVVRYSEIIGFDVSDYFEKFGLKVNASTKSKISVYPKWMVLL